MTSCGISDKSWLENTSIRLNQTQVVHDYNTDAYNIISKGRALAAAPETIVVFSNNTPPLVLLGQMISFALPLLFGIFLGSFLSRGNKSKQPKERGVQETKDSNHKHPPVVVVQTDPPSRPRLMQGTNYEDTVRESGIDPCDLPKHVAVIMDGNRRYGRRTYNGQAARGHFDGGKKAIQFIEWCDTEELSMVTLYAFSTENWNRSKEEIDILMMIFERFIHNELRPLTYNRQIRCNHLCSDKDKIPASVLQSITLLCQETQNFTGTLTLNVCMSYGGRSEIVNTTQAIAQQCLDGTLHPSDITEQVFADHLTTGGFPEIEILFRTSGEYRLSNFLLWQVAYAELFFLGCDWPELQKSDLITILHQYVKGRQRRFGR